MLKKHAIIQLQFIINKQKECTVMGKLKAILGISAIAGAVAAVFAYKKKKEMEEYEYEEEFDECFCDECCYPDEETANEAIEKAAEEAVVDEAAEIVAEEIAEEAEKNSDE